MLARFELSRHFQRPVVDIVVGGKICTALIDTGAVFPVYTLGAAELKKIGGVFEKTGVPIGGLGGRCIGDLYRIDLRLGCLHYPSMPIVCIEDSGMLFEFIFSVSMMSGFRYTIDDDERSLTIDTKSDATDLHLHVRDSSGTIHVLIEH